VWKYLAWVCGIDRGSSYDTVSVSCRRAILRAEARRGVDLPTWRTPKEVQELRRQERRTQSSLRIVREDRTGTDE